MQDTPEQNDYGIENLEPQKNIQTIPKMFLKCLVISLINISLIPFCQI